MTDPADARPTPLLDLHRAGGGMLVPFSGWLLPLHYGSQVEEHHVVRRAAGMFDVSHMARVEVSGAGAAAWLRGLLALDVARLEPGRGAYGCLLDASAGILDDLIAYRTGPAEYLLVVNAGPAARTLAWLHQHAAGADVALREGAPAMIAVQGPQARAAVHAVLPGLADDLPRLGCAATDGVFAARSGYTGEDGYELAGEGARIGALWQALVRAGVQPAGLGARDTLRLEAGLNLYGQDMDSSVLPDECGLAWTVHLDDPARDFIGRAALLERRAQGLVRRRVGVVLTTRGVIRTGAAVAQDGRPVGVLTSGGFGPTAGRGIGIARVEGAQPGACTIEVRGRPLPGAVVNLPFVRGGEPVPGLPPLDAPA